MEEDIKGDSTYKQEIVSTLERTGVMEEMKAQLRSQLINKLTGKLTCTLHTIK